MNPYLNEETNRQGELVRVDFFPDANMLRFAMARASLKNNDLKDEEVMRQVGIPPRRLAFWREQHNPYFEAWLMKAIENFTAPVREALFAFGVDQAFKGNYNFWKDVSRSVGAISAEKVEVHTVSQANVDELSKKTEAELIQLEEQLLAELTGRGSNKALTVAETSSGEEPTSGEPGTSPLQEGPLVLHNDLVCDGGCPGPGEPTQAVSSETAP